MTDRVYEFKDQRIREYLGDIDYYLEERAVASLREIEKRDVQKTVVKVKDSKQSYEDQKKLKSLNNRLSKVEAKINKLEREIKEIDVELAVNYDKVIAKPNFFDGYQKKKKDLEKLMEDWEVITEELEVLS